MSEQSDPDALMNAVAGIVYQNLNGDNREFFERFVDSASFDNMMDSVRDFNLRNRQDSDERAE
jgi:hypothetical protein